PFARAREGSARAATAGRSRRGVERGRVRRLRVGAAEGAPRGRTRAAEGGAAVRRPAAGAREARHRRARRNRSDRVSRVGLPHRRLAHARCARALSRSATGAAAVGRDLAILLLVDVSGSTDEGPSGVTVRAIKRFDERYDTQIAQRIAALEPE